MSKRENDSLHPGLGPADQNNPVTDQSTTEDRVDQTQTDPWTPPDDMAWTGRVADWFYRDRRLVALLLLLIVAAGGTSILSLPRMEDPVLSSRTALVLTRLPGADAERVESLVTEKIESRLRDVPEIKEVSSVSRVGVSTITIELADRITETETVWPTVRGKIEDSIADLPAGATRPFFDELNTRAYALILGVRWIADSPADPRVLRRLAIDLQDRLQNLGGTEVVDLFGDPGEEIRVTVDPRQAASLGLTPAEAAAAAAGYDAKGTAGRLVDDQIALTLGIADRFDAVDNLRQVPVQSSDGSDVRLGEIADVQLTTPDPPPRGALLNGRDAVVLGAMVRQDKRIDLWTDAAEAMLDQYSQTLPAEVDLDRAISQDGYVQRRLSSVVKNLGIGAGSVAIVILIMMGWRAAMVVAFSLPLTSLLVLFGYRVLEIPIHQMSMTGLIIAMGLLIDAAIVVVDEVRGNLIAGQSPRQAAAETVSHLFVPLLGSTVTTALAFAPIALMPGGGGEFVGAIAIGVILAIFSSLVLAVTLVTSLAARLVGGSPTSQTGTNPRNPLRRFFESGLSPGPLLSGYRGALRIVLRRPWLGVAASLVAPVIGFVAAGTIREQFFPPTDRNQYHVQVDLPITATIDHTRQTAKQIDQVLRRRGAQRVDWYFADSAPAFYYNVVGQRRGQSNYAQAVVTLPQDIKPIGVIRQVQNELDQSLVGPRILVRQLEQGPPFEAPVELRLFGPDLATLRQLGEEVRRRLANHPNVIAVRTDLSEVLPEVALDVDESIAGSTGLTPEGIASTLAATLSGANGGNVIQDNEEVLVSVRVDQRSRSDAARLATLEIPMPTRNPQATKAAQRMIPISALGQLSLRPKSAVIPRMDRRRMNEVSVYLTAGVLPSTVQTLLADSLKRNPLDLPPGYQYEFGGEADKRADSVGNLLSSVGLLAIAAAATLVLSFSSFRMAGLIGVAGFASIGLGLLALKLSGFPFGFMAIIGTMGLLGVAINDSIVVLASLRDNQAASGGDIDATIHEVVHCTRHVISTTVTTCAGFTPLILDGGDFWPPLAVCIAGGVIGSSLLALIFIPSAHQWIVRPKAQGH